MVSVEYSHFLQGSSVIDAVASLATFRKPGAAAGTDAKLKLSTHNLSIFAPIAVNILANAHSKSSAWPTVFIQVFFNHIYGCKRSVETLN